MAFQNFSFPRVLEQLGLSMRDSDELIEVPPIDLSADFVRRVGRGAALAAANATEKARSEFIVAPVLLELHERSGGKFSLFSGVEWEADAERGLNGYCDFLLTRGESQYAVGPPFIAVVEAKNDNVRGGLGQCVAAMTGAVLCNEKVGRVGRPIFGVTTTGQLWQFLRLDGASLTMLRPEMVIDQLPRIMGILSYFVEQSTP